MARWRRYRGAHTNAGEFGHTVMQLDGPRCVCGRAGCLEILHDTAVADGQLGTAARVLATGIVNLLQTTDVNHIVLAGADLLRFPEVYETATRDAIPRSHWLDVSVTLAELGADVIAAGAAMQVLQRRVWHPFKNGCSFIIIGGVIDRSSRTAEHVALFRALETVRPGGGLFRDPPAWSTAARRPGP